MPVKKPKNNGAFRKSEIGRLRLSGSIVRRKSRRSNGVRRPSERRQKNRKLERRKLRRIGRTRPARTN